MDIGAQRGNRGYHLDPTSPLESFFDLSHLSVSFNVQDVGRTLVSSFTLQNTPALQAKDRV